MNSNQKSRPALHAQVSNGQWTPHTLTGGIALANFADVITGSAQADVIKGLGAMMRSVVGVGRM